MAETYAVSRFQASWNTSRESQSEPATVPFPIPEVSWNSNAEWPGRCDPQAHGVMSFVGGCSACCWSNADVTSYPFSTLFLFSGAPTIGASLPLGLILWMSASSSFRLSSCWICFCRSLYLSYSNADFSRAIWWLLLPACVNNSRPLSWIMASAGRLSDLPSSHETLAPGGLLPTRLAPAPRSTTPVEPVCLTNVAFPVLSTISSTSRTSAMRQFRGSITRPGARCLRFVPLLPSTTQDSLTAGG